MMLWRAGPLSVISGGAIMGIIAGSKPVQRLKDLN